jgi:tetratricopeptide (TPR) repeat protein
MRFGLRRKKNTPPSAGESEELAELTSLFSEALEFGRNDNQPEAEKRLQKCIAGFSKCLSRNYEMASSSHEYLARSYEHMDRWSEAEEHLKMCEAIRMKYYGASHPATLRAVIGLVRNLMDQEKFENARKKAKGHLGKLSPTLASPEKFGLVVDLGRVYAKFHRHEEALACLVQACQGLVDTVGENHSQTVYAQYYRGKLLSEMRRLTDAESVLKSVQTICANKWGPQGAYYRMVTIGLGSVQVKMYKFAEAEHSLTSILPASKKDVTHIDWTTNLVPAVRDLIHAYTALGREEDAQKVRAWMNGEIESVQWAKTPKEQATSVTRPSAPMSSEESFHWDIKIIDAKGDAVLATALLDTACQTGNWISQRLVERLGKTSSISQDFAAPSVADANGNSVRATGVVTLEFKRGQRGNRFYESQFFVFPPFSNHFDVIFGVEYIVRENLLSVSEDVLVPLVLHKKLDKKDKAAIAIAEEKRRQERDALEARRQAAQSGSAAQSQVSRGSGSQQGGQNS